jgi:transmembrane sensor
MSLNADDMNWERLASYLSGELSSEEVAEVELWLSASSEHRELVDQLHAAWRRTAELPEIIESVDVQAAWSRAAVRLPEETPNIHKRPSFTLESVVSRQRMKPALAAAAAVLVAVSAAALWRLTLHTSNLAPGIVPSSAASVYATGRGERGAVTLPDGTRLILAPDSRLRAPRAFGRATRDVELEGAAFFQVAHNPAHPFLVHAANAVTQVLGTEFSVTAYPGERQVEVVVKTGRVGVRGAVLTHGQLGRVEANGAVSVLQNVDLDRYFAWTEGRLVFEDATLGEALPKLSRWFDLDFRISDSSLANRQLTASFHDQPSANALDLLASSLDLRYERHDRTVTLYPKGPAR